MDTLQPEVITALTATGYNVDYSFPQGGRSLPSISWSEYDNSDHARADGREYATRVGYAVDLWSMSADELITMSQAVDTRLVALGLKRTFSMDLAEQDTGVQHRSMRYTGIIHIDQQKIYQ